MILNRHVENVKWAFGMIAMLSAVLFITKFFGGNAAREPSSVELQKDKAGPEHKAPGKPQAKASSRFAVSIAALRDFSAEPNSPVELEAEIEVMTDTKGAEFAWILPSGVIAVGAATGSLGDLAQGQVLKLRFSGVSAAMPTLPVHLHVFKTVKGVAQGIMVQYMPGQLEAVAEASTTLQKASVKNRGTAATSDLKVMQ